MKECTNGSKGWESLAGGSQLTDLKLSYNFSWFLADWKFGLHKTLPQLVFFINFQAT